MILWCHIFNRNNALRAECKTNPRGLWKISVKVFTAFNYIFYVNSALLITVTCASLTMIMFYTVHSNVSIN